MALVAREKYGQILSLWQAPARIERVLPGGLKTVAVMGETLDERPIILQSPSEGSVSAADRAEVLHDRRFRLRRDAERSPSRQGRLADYPSSFSTNGANEPRVSPIQSEPERRDFKTSSSDAFVAPTK